jgi:hypothetical protein
MNSLRSALFSSTAAVLLCGLSHVADAAELDDATIRQMDATFADQRTRTSLTKRLRTSPILCTEVAPGQEICTWKITQRMSMWESLHEMVDTKYPVNVVCQVPMNDGSRSVGTCTIHARESIGSMRPPSRAKDRSRRLKKIEELKPKAWEVIDAYLTPLELSRLVGQGPTSCTLADDVRFCLWKATSQTEGHGLLADAIGTMKKVRLRCEMPADGSPRAKGSCRVEIGD